MGLNPSSWTDISPPGNLWIIDARYIHDYYLVTGLDPITNTGRVFVKKDLIKDNWADIIPNGNSDIRDILFIKDQFVAWGYDSTDKPGIWRSPNPISGPWTDMKTPPDILHIDNVFCSNNQLVVVGYDGTTEEPQNWGISLGPDWLEKD